MSSFTDRCAKIGTLYSEIDVSQLTKIHLFSRFLEEAVKCFYQNLVISCITVSSALTERTLFFEKIRRQPPTAGEGMRKPNLGGLFKHFITWDILLANLIDMEERLNLELMKKRGRKKENIEKSIYQLKFIETRNLFSHGKELLIPIPLAHLLPDNEESLSRYGIDFEEFNNPNIETIAYTHLSKTLRFLKAYSDYISKGGD